MTKVAVMGSGSWGTAFAMMCHDAGQQPVLWARRQEVADEVIEGWDRRQQDGIIDRFLVKPVQVVDAQLVESKEAPVDREAMEKFYREACQWYANRWPDRWKEKEKSGRWWAWSQTRAKFKRPDDERMPRGFWDASLRPTSLETAGWLKSQMIRYAKGKAKGHDKKPKDDDDD